MSEDRLPDLAAPSWKLLALEARALVEVPLFALRKPRLRGLPRGDGHPVMVIPGSGVHDLVTAPLRRALRELGYSVYGFGYGFNLGMRNMIKAGLMQRLNDLYESYEAPVSLIGWSLGGVFVREMARLQPQQVRRVITLGSPINGHPEANHLVSLFSLANRGRAARTDVEGFLRRRQPPPVPCTAIYSKSDGIVTWSCCLEEPAPNTENVEVSGSHLGLVCNPRALRIIAQRLARRPVQNKA